MSNKRLLKELTQLRKSPPSASNHQILTLGPTGEDLYIWEAVIAKQTTSDSPYYYNGQWTLDIRVPEQYPQIPPKVWFSKKTPILHPNIEFDTGEICLDILKAESWSPAWTLEYVVVAITMLIDDPEPDSPLNLDLANLFRFDTLAFESMVQYTIWKYGTFYQEDDELLREKSGIKVVDGVLPEDVETTRIAEETNTAMQALQSQAEEVAAEVKDISIENKQEDTLATRINDSAHHNEPDRHIIHVRNDAIRKIDDRVESLQDQKRALEKSPSAAAPGSPNIDVIHKVGKQVTQEFLAKMDEINSYHSPNSSEEIALHEIEDINRVKRQVTDNVSKQVNELCLRSTSPELADAEIIHPPESEDVLRIKQQFMKQVDDQMRARQENSGCHLAPPESVSDVDLQATLELSTMTDGSKQLSLSKIKRTISLRKSKRRSLKNKP